MYLSQNGWARKSRPTQVAPRSNNLENGVSKRPTKEGEGVIKAIGEGGIYRKGYQKNQLASPSPKHSKESGMVKMRREA